jgi:hypothetical protein
MSAARKYVMPAPPEVGPQPPLTYEGDNIGLGAGEVHVLAHGPGGYYTLTLEQALRNIDLFAEPGRTRILWALPYEFEIPGAES